MDALAPVPLLPGRRVARHALGAFKEDADGVVLPIPQGNDVREDSRGALAEGGCGEVVHALPLEAGLAQGGAGSRLTDGVEGVHALHHGEGELVVLLQEAGFAAGLHAGHADLALLDEVQEAAAAEAEAEAVDVFVHLLDDSEADFWRQVEEAPCDERVLAGDVGGNDEAGGFEAGLGLGEAKLGLGEPGEVELGAAELGEAVCCRRDGEVGHILGGTSFFHLGAVGFRLGGRHCSGDELKLCSEESDFEEILLQDCQNLQEIRKSADDGKQRMDLASQMGWVVSCLYTRIEILACIKIHLRAGRPEAIDFGSKSHRERLLSIRVAARIHYLVPKDRRAGTCQLRATATPIQLA